MSSIQDLVNGIAKLSFSQRNELTEAAKAKGVKLTIGGSVMTVEEMLETPAKAVPWRTLQDTVRAIEQAKHDAVGLKTAAHAKSTRSGCEEIYEGERERLSGASGVTVGGNDVDDADSKPTRSAPSAPSAKRAATPSDAEGPSADWRVLKAALEERLGEEGLNMVKVKEMLKKKGLIQGVAYAVKAPAAVVYQLALDTPNLV